MDIFQGYFYVWLGSNLAAIIFLWVAFHKPRIARFLFAILFGWACWINYTTAHNNPTDYIAYASLTPFSTYRDFIQGWFATHITTMVTFIAVGQGFISLGMLLKGWWVRAACYGAMVFLLAIAPLGIGSGFPFSIIACFALYFILKKDDLGLLWKKKVN